MSATATSCFGFGSRGGYQIALSNENEGRPVLPFPGMRSSDAHWWSRNPHDRQLLSRFEDFSQQELQQFRTTNNVVAPLPPLARIGTKTVIKNSRTINDCWIGEQCYIKGANKLKNLTILSQPEQRVQIGEGVELVNGIIAGGSKIFYGSKAVRFVCDQNSQLKYGARLINSFLGCNSTVSCGELLNSLLLPAHEQHHNNSFLIAAAIGGQSNIAAGATLGSNHNSRAADGEMIADRGFWPGLNSSVKFNSRFAAFTLLSKGDYNEINNPFPFTLLAQSPAGLVVLPAYWFRYNIYALERNSWKFSQRDQRLDPQQFYQKSYLAPDTVTQIMTAVELLQQQPPATEIKMTGITRGSSAIIRQPQNAVVEYRRMLEYYAGTTLTEWLQTASNDLSNRISQLKQLPLYSQWLNLGGHIMPEKRLQCLRTAIIAQHVNSWDAVHQQYDRISHNYRDDQARHALQLLAYLYPDLNPIAGLTKVLHNAAATATLIYQRAAAKRRQDYQDGFRRSCYNSNEELETVLGNRDLFLEYLEDKQQTVKEAMHNLMTELENSKC